MGKNLPAEMGKRSPPEAGTKLVAVIQVDRDLRKSCMTSLYTLTIVTMGMGDIIPDNGNQNLNIRI